MLREQLDRVRALHSDAATPLRIVVLDGGRLLVFPGPAGEARLYADAGDPRVFADRDAARAAAALPLRAPGDVVEDFTARFNAGGAAGLEGDALTAGFEELLDPAVEYVNPPDAIETGTHHGIEGFTRAMENLRLAGVDGIELRLLVEREGAVAATARAHIAGATSGVRTSGQWLGFVYTVRDALVTRFEWFSDPEEPVRRVAGA